MLHPAELLVLIKFKMISQVLFLVREMFKKVDFNKSSPKKRTVWEIILFLEVPEGFTI